MRGGHLDLCVLGAFQVAENGDLANWARSDDDNAPAIGGAMDLAAGAKRIWVVMEHNTRSGEPRLLRRCSYPLTAAACVKRVYTELAVIDVNPEGFKVIDMVPGLSFDELQARTEAPTAAGLSRYEWAEKITVEISTTELRLILADLRAIRRDQLAQRDYLRLNWASGGYSSSLDRR